MNKICNNRPDFGTRLPDTLLVLLIRFVPVAWIMTSEFMLLGLSDLAWLSRFFQTEQNFVNHLVTVFSISCIFTFRKAKVLGLFHGVTAHFVLIKLILKEKNEIIFRIYPSDFQITQGTKQCVCQCTNYHNTTKHNEYLPQLELLWSCDIYAVN